MGGVGSGRKIKYNDIYHVLHRQKAREYRARLREAAVHSEQSKLLEVLA